MKGVFIMPTGYTSAIADGIEFKDFALRCARAFGALVELPITQRGDAKREKGREAGLRGFRSCAKA
jgi:hypothetical protein